MTEVSDEFVERIARLPKLTWLTIDSDRFTDKTIDTIASKMKLEFLWISSRQFTAKGIQRLKQIPGIEDLRVNGELTRLKQRPSAGERKLIMYSP